MKMRTLKTTYILALTAACNIVSAQTPLLKFTKGDVYNVKTFIATTTRLQHGKKQVDFSSKGSIAKTYQITNATNNGTDLTLTVKHITDTITAFDNKLNYNSDKAANSGSEIETYLSSLINKNQLIKLDDKGVVTNTPVGSLTVDNAKLIEQASLFNDPLLPGSRPQFLANPALPAEAKIGSTWTKTDKSLGQVTTTYTLKKMDDNTVTVVFASVAKQPNAGINTNGFLTIDRKSGVVIRRSLKSIMMTYGREENGEVYGRLKKWSIEEVAEKAK